MGIDSATVEEPQDERGRKQVSTVSQRHPNHDLFICDGKDAIPKEDMGEHGASDFLSRPSRIPEYCAMNIATSK